jgi:hypothetical protein
VYTGAEVYPLKVGLAGVGPSTRKMVRSPRAMTLGDS